VAGRDWIATASVYRRVTVAARTQDATASLSKAEAAVADLSRVGVDLAGITHRSATHSPDLASPSGDMPLPASRPDAQKAVTATSGESRTI
jgi:hypothetical protein